MKSRIDSRAKFIDATAELLRRQGYHGTGIKEIVKESGAPRGSLYFLFPGGKQELAREAITKSGDEMRATLEALVRAASSPGDAIRAVTTFLADQLEASDYLHGCPVATVALEAAAQEPELQAVCSASYASWQALIAEYLVSHGTPSELADGLANLALSSVEGALLLSRAHKDASPLRSVGETLAAVLGSMG